MYVFLFHAFLNVTYISQEASFPLMQFTAALSLWADFQLRAGDSLFLHWGHLLWNPALLKETGWKKKTHNETFGSIWLDVGTL